MQEQQMWRDVDGYEGLYEVSNDGQVRRLQKLLDSAHFEGIRKPRHLLKQGKNLQGRRQVTLCKDNVPKRFQVHRLVLEAFAGPCPTGMEGKHKDGDHQHNHIDNLEWGTHESNMQDKARHGTQIRGEQSAQARIDEAAVREIRTLAVVMTQRELAAQFGISQVAINHILNGRTWKHVK